MYKKLLALSTLSGTIIGVGLFGLPYVTSKIGFWPMVFYFLVLGLVMIVISLMYGEIALRTLENHRLPGYGRIYLNRWASSLSYLTTIVGLTGSLLAYIIIGGQFLSNLLIPFFGGTTFLYSTIFFILGAIIIYYGSGPVSKTEFFSLGLFLIVLFILFFKALPHINLQYFGPSDLSYFFLPYGIILFSLGGLAVVPEMKEILKNQEKSMKSLLIIGLLIPIITYLLFIVTIYGVTGPLTTDEGMIGLNQVLGGGVAILGFVFGLITTFTSFLTLGITLKKEFQYDRGMPSIISWLLACLPAYALFAIGLKNFIGIIGFVGSIALGIDIIVIAIIFFQAKLKSQRIPAYSLNLKPPLVFGLVLLFVAGIILEIIHLLT